MVIMHNLGAMNAQRQYNIVSNRKSKKTEKLSSGYKINRAADDAAGLAISEKMRGQIRGLGQSMRNIQDAISLCNVADGALNEVHDILGRIKELAVQSANDTNTDEDREHIDSEVQLLFEEIDRIGETTEFNKMPVFQEVGKEYVSGPINPTTDGEFFKLMGDNVSQTGYMQEELAKDKLSTLKNTGAHDQGDNPYVSVKIDFNDIIDNNEGIKRLVDTEFYVNCCTDCCPNHIIFTDEVGMSKEGSTVYIGVKKTEDTYYSDAEEFCNAIVDADVSASHVEYACEGSVLYLYDIDNNNWSQKSKELAYFCDMPAEDEIKKTKFDGIHIQMGANEGESMWLAFGELSVRKLGLYGDNCLSRAASQKLLSRVDNSNVLLSRQRGKIGAYTNRLEHAYDANANTQENMQAAESRIRDADMAEEMVQYSKDSILEQVGQAMMSQANQSTQNVLQLLQ